MHLVIQLLLLQQEDEEDRVYILQSGEVSVLPTFFVYKVLKHSCVLQFAGPRDVTVGPQHEL